MPKLQNLNNNVRVAQKKRQAKPKVQTTVSQPAPPDGASLVRELQKVVERIPAPHITVPAPVVNVAPPEVTVNVDAEEIGRATAKALNEMRPLPVAYHATIERSSRNKMTGARIVPVFPK